MLRRLQVLQASVALDLRLRRLRKEESAALAQAGRLFRTASAEPGPTPTGPVAAALAGVAELEERARVLTERLVSSLEADRRDFRATGSALGRGLIVVRGILDRMVLRDEAGGARRALPARQRELGQQVAEDGEALERLPAADRERLLAARAARVQAERQRTALLAPHGNDPLPPALRTLWGELRAFGTLLGDELTRKVYLRLPALAAMAAAWWLTQRYTTTRVESNLHRFTGEGRTGLSAGAYDLLSFALPLVVAALVAHLLASITRRIRRRYEGETLAAR
ncbi:MAG TPA: hypothetical protein VF530_14795 [Planctomycetota bacterium]